MSHILDAITFLLCLGVIISVCMCRGEAVIPYQAAALAVAVLIAAYQHGQAQRESRRQR